MAKTVHLVREAEAALGDLRGAFKVVAGVAEAVELESLKERGSDIAEDLSEAGRRLRRAGFSTFAAGCFLYADVSGRGRAPKAARMPWELKERAS